MFRRNRPVMQNNVLSASQIEVLARANQMVATNNPAGAAPLYTELARELDGNRPRPAANLHARAAHAYADSGNEQLALAQARTALTMFIQYRMINRTPVFFANITRKLNNKGMKNSASALQNEFGNRVGPMPPPPAQGPARRGALPTNCPKCGAPIHSDEATWIDNQTAECDYCGASIRTTN
ncbi:MAG TPA: hypothetical protein VLX61_08555 [Anaerolineales bacterium]|nr:hypothetical protein [Anaerolineales bacterium]